jgi:hypothetical protein
VPVPAPRDAIVSSHREAPAHPTAILAIICISYFMVILDNSIIFTGLPRIATAMQFSPSGLPFDVGRLRTSPGPPPRVGSSTPAHDSPIRSVLKETRHGQALAGHG